VSDASEAADVFGLESGSPVSISSKASLKIVS
jgi:hypothetical protein